MNIKNQKLEIKAFKLEVERYKNDKKKHKKIEGFNKETEQLIERWKFLRKWQKSLLEQNIIDKTII